MTGTALTEEKEFRDIYGMDVIAIPTNKPVIRVDLQDAVYKTKKEKYHAVVQEVIEAHKKGQPDWWEPLPLIYPKKSAVF